MMTSRPPRTRTLVLGIDPGRARPKGLAASIVLSLDEVTRGIGVVQPAEPMSKAALKAFLADDPLLAHPELRMVCLAAPLTPLPLERRPWKARAVEIRLARGAFSSAERGPHMPWIANAKVWPRYEQAVPLLHALVVRRYPLLTLTAVTPSSEFPHRCTAEVFPKASLAVLAPREPLRSRPLVTQFFGQLDDWLFPQLFTASDTTTSPPIEACLQSLSSCLHLDPGTLLETQRIARIRRPSPRREPLRAFVAALQGILALAGAGCLVGATGDHEGSLLLPASWHPDWETEWSDGRRAVPKLQRIPVRPFTDPQVATFAPLEQAPRAMEESDRQTSGESEAASSEQLALGASEARGLIQCIQVRNFKSVSKEGEDGNGLDEIQVG